MCTEISPSIALGISLRSKRCVCADRLRKKRQELMSEDDDMLVDVSYSSIRRVVEMYTGALSLRCTMGTFGICKKKNTTGCHDRIFDNKYIRESLATCLNDEEFKELEQVMLSR